MVSYKAPSFQDRLARAADAKLKALDRLRAKPPVDPAELEKRRADAEARDLAQAEKRNAKAAAQAAAAAAREAAAKAAAQKVVEAPAPAPAAAAPTEAEKKALRDARYAARKGRK